MAEFQYQDPKPSKVPLITLGARIVTTISLVASIIILKSDKLSFKVDSQKYQFSYNDATSYQYVLFSMVVGFAYTVFQIPFAIYYLKTGKSLIKSITALPCMIYSVTRQIGLILLATSVGAAFGVTIELKRSADNLKTIDGFDAADYRSKMGDFCSMAYLSAGFHLIGFVSTTVSSIISSLALSKQP